MDKHLNTEPNFANPDDFYAALTDTHRDLSQRDSERLNARLVLLLSNHIGDMQVIKEALEIAADLEPEQGESKSEQESE